MTSLARSKVPGDNALVETSISSLAGAASPLTRWGNARSPRITTTHSETTNSNARMVFARIVIHLATGASKIRLITPAAATATPYGTVVLLVSVIRFVVSVPGALRTR